jgi:hypothetical protein
MLRSNSARQGASGLEQREKGLAGGSRGMAMNAPSSLAWMLSEILQGCPVWHSFLLITVRLVFRLRLCTSIGFPSTIRVSGHSSETASVLTQPHLSLYAAPLIRKHILLSSCSSRAAPP